MDIEQAPNKRQLIGKDDIIQPITNLLGVSSHSLGKATQYLSLDCGTLPQ